MSRTDWRSIPPQSVGAERVSLLLQQHGWEMRGGRPGQYVRWANPRFDDVPRLIIPLNRQNADYDELVQEALETLGTAAASHPATINAVLDRLVEPPGDEVKFRKDVATVRGAIPWKAGEELISAARSALVAAAKSRISRRPHYGAKNARFAHRYLDSVLMGQTDIGSYIVTAYTPVDQEFPEKEVGVQPQLPGIGSHTGRQITRSLVRALSATVEAITEATRTASVRCFEESVAEGVSRDFVQSIRELVAGGEGADVSVEFTGAIEDERDGRSSRQTFAFDQAHDTILERAARRLAQLAPSAYVTVTGRVTVLARPRPGQPGLVRLRVVGGSEARTLRIPLAQGQFEVAAPAISGDQVLVVSGRQEKVGSLYWLYDATDLAVVDLSHLSPRRAADVAQLL